MKDFFVSYTSANRAWAEQIAEWLQQAGFSVVIQTNDFVAGSNFVSKMHDALEQAQRTIAVLSPEYLQAPFPTSE